MVILLPKKSLKAMAKPTGIPITLAMHVDAELTFKETNTIL
jgi:hypothetical protein